MRRRSSACKRGRLRTSSPLKQKTNPGLTLRLVQQMGHFRGTGGPVTPRRLRRLARTLCHSNCGLWHRHATWLHAVPGRVPIPPVPWPRCVVMGFAPLLGAELNAELAKHRAGANLVRIAVDIVFITGLFRNANENQAGYGVHPSRSRITRLS